MKINIVMVEPEIPQNTGNIARTCAAIGAKLHLVEPLGFKVTDKYLKRAGLDYWDKLDIEMHNNLDEFLKKYGKEIKNNMQGIKQYKCSNNMFLASTKSQITYSDVNYNQFEEIFILFGKETKGLPEDLIKENLQQAIRIPMRNGLRSLNLSNSVAIIAYEILRQNKFKGLKEESNYFNSNN